MMRGKMNREEDEVYKIRAEDDTMDDKQSNNEEEASKEESSKDTKSESIGLLKVRKGSKYASYFSDEYVCILRSVERKMDLPRIKSITNAQIPVKLKDKEIREINPPGRINCQL